MIVGCPSFGAPSNVFSHPCVVNAVQPGVSGHFCFRYGRPLRRASLSHTIKLTMSGEDAFNSRIIKTVLQVFLEGRTHTPPPHPKRFPRLVRRLQTANPKMIRSSLWRQGPSTCSTEGSTQSSLLHLPPDEEQHLGTAARAPMGLAKGHLGGCTGKRVWKGSSRVPGFNGFQIDRVSRIP